MRRILLLLIGLLALGATLPAPAATGHGHHGIHDSMPPGHCPDQAPGLAHVCIGCATRPADLPNVPPATALILARPEPAPMHMLEGRKPSFEPPPPRRAA